MPHRKRRVTMRFYFFIAYVVLAIVGFFVLMQQVNKETEETAGETTSALEETLQIINEDNALKEDYVPSTLVNVYNVREDQLIGVDNINIMLDATALRSAQAMITAAKKEGYTGYIIVSGYRSYSDQKALYDKKQEDGENNGLIKVAKPGCSEHQTGLAMDITNQQAINEGKSLTESLDNNEGMKWIIDHCTEYGFIVRYPEDKTQITGVVYEPWHLRYVGLPYSGIMKKNNWCLEEYIETLN